MRACLKIPRRPGFKGAWKFCVAPAVIPLGLLLSGCEKNGAGPGAPLRAVAATNGRPDHYYLDHAQPRLRTLKLWLADQGNRGGGGVSLTEVSTGMMFRTNLAESAGMLFVFGGSDQRSFYMKNCVVALSAAYIDTEGVINQIVELHPGVETPVSSRSSQIQYVLEMPQGWFERHSGDEPHGRQHLSRHAQELSWRLAVKPMISSRSLRSSIRRGVCNTFPGVSIRPCAPFAPWGASPFSWTGPKVPACGTSMATN